MGEIRVSGDGIELGNALSEKVHDRISAAAEKYFDGGYQGNVIVSRDGKQIRCEARVHLDSGADLAGSGVAGDAHSAFDLAAEHLEKRLRRYKRKMHDHHNRDKLLTVAPNYVIETPDFDDEQVGDDPPLIIAETQTRVWTMTVSMAMLELDLQDATVLLFNNAAHGGLNVVYRRPDGNIGWIDPTNSTEAGEKEES